MDTFTRAIHTRPRLSAALSLLSGGGTVADIGCDHGRLGVALLQRGLCARVIAADVSAPSLDKARRLADLTGVSDRMETRLGDGFTPLKIGEADAVALLGMGGTLMREILSASPVPLHGAKAGVFQPMRGVADIRRYLDAEGYTVTHDRVVSEGGRYYQVFRAVPPEADAPCPPPLPDGWPEDCFFLGYRAFQDREALLLPLCEKLLAQRLARLAKAEVPRMRGEARQLEQIIAALTREHAPASPARP